MLERGRHLAVALVAGTLTYFGALALTGLRPADMVVRDHVV